jgi:ABC-type polysaccharide/polyol phosphate export permease
MAFFVTPVFWNPAQMAPQKRFIAEMNPLWHMLELVREPLLGRMPIAAHWVWGVSVAAILSVAAIIILALFRKRVVFWV